MERKMWDVQTISNETIKPSSPTPPHLRTLKLSLLDQIAPSIYVSMVFFFEGDNNGDPTMKIADKSRQLKQSLSETLTRFYPLAGRIKESGIIDCSDEGVDFLEARVDGTLSEFLTEGFDVMELNKLVPCTVEKPKSGNNVILAVQLNFFTCGGMAIAVGASHVLVDGASVISLMNNWAATTGRSGKIIWPNFDSASFLPHKDPSSVPRFAFPPRKNVKATRFVFDATKIAQIKARATKDSSLRPLTSVEAVSALIWRCFIRAQREAWSCGAFVAMHAVNLRPIMVPSLPDSFGNIWVPIFTSGVVLGREYNEEKDLDYSLLLRLLKDAKQNVDTNFIEELQGPNGFQKAHESGKDVVEKYSEYGIGTCEFTSLGSFPLYEVDFGWGKPIWVSVCPLPIPNGVFLFPTRSGNGIEAMVQLEEEVLAKLVKDQELLSFVSSSNITHKDFHLFPRCKM